MEEEGATYIVKKSHHCYKYINDVLVVAGGGGGVGGSTSK